MFDWPRFLRAHGIDYIDHGPSTARDNIYVHCPFCGTSDESRHMGISTVKDAYGCWKNDAHRGRNRARLIKALLDCSWDEAQRLAGYAVTVNRSNSSMGDAVRQMLRVRDTAERIPHPNFTREMVPIEERAFGNLFVEYLMKRFQGCAKPKVLGFATAHGLRYCVRGPFRYRLIIPVFDEGGIVTWTGRSIVGHVEPRYRTLSIDAEASANAGLPRAMLSISDTLWSQDTLQGGNTLVVCEGPFDAMRLAFAGQDVGLHATCFFGKQMSDMQRSLLLDVASRYKNKFVLLDSDATFDAVGLLDKLRRGGFKRTAVPDGYKDPGELPLRLIDELVQKLTRKTSAW